MSESKEICKAIEPQQIISAKQMVQKIKNIMEN